MRTVLVTGGTGSFGQAFVRHLLDTTDSLVRVFSRDEQKQDRMKREVNDARVRYLLGDVRDAARTKRAMRGCDLVVHAAALKIIPAGEYNPDEVVRTNINGSENVINAAIDTGVAKVICISSDKAVAPVNLYGATKMCMERLAVLANQYSRDTAISVVRYGNVIGSRGSILTMLREQVRNGGLRITHSDMTRFWMTLPQACQFVWSAQAHMQGGEIYIPKLPSAYVLDLCHTLHPAAPVGFTGLRNGEKMHEVLSNGYEVVHDDGWAYTVREGEWEPDGKVISSAAWPTPAAQLLAMPEFAQEVARAAA